MNNIKIMVIDDTKSTTDVHNIIQDMGYKISDTLSIYSNVLNIIKDNEPSIILISINSKNSKDVLNTVLEIQKYKEIPIIYLTTFLDDETTSKTLRTNPIGYLQKPLKKEDLKSMLALAMYKINLSTKDTQDSHLKHLSFGYYYDLEKENLYFKNSPVKLGVKEKLLLSVLVKADGQIVSFEELEHLLWEDTLVSESSLRTLIYRLRNKLKHELIETIPSFGIKLIKNI